MNELIEKIKEKPEELGQIFVVIFGLLYLIQTMLHKPIVVADEQLVKKIQGYQAELKDLEQAGAQIIGLQEELAQLGQNIPDITKNCFHINKKREAIEAVFAIFQKFGIEVKNFQPSKLESKNFGELHYFTQDIKINVSGPYNKIGSLLYELENYEKMLSVGIFNMIPAGEDNFFEVKPIVVTLFFHDEAPEDNPAENTATTPVSTP